MSTLPKNIQQILTCNWQPKLICLVLAILVWVLVDCFYVQVSNEEWDLNNIRFSTPE